MATLRANSLAAKSVKLDFLNVKGTVMGLFVEVNGGTSWRERQS